MKILYFGTVCDIKNYNNLMSKCRVRPSVATIVFETALLDGFKKNGVQMEIYSFPMIPTFPQSSLLHFGNNTEKLDCGYECKWLNTVNVSVLKQLSRRLSARKAIKRWIAENRDEGIIFTYSIPPFMVQDIIKLSKENCVKVFAIIPDLLRDMYINENAESLLTKLKNKYLSPALKLQGEYDGYIYLTEDMKSVVAPDKPYMVMEGIAEISGITHEADIKKASPRSIMYAGMLHEKYGIINLMDAFEKLNASDVELWLFGNGTAVDEIKCRAAVNPKIKYFGTVNREEILEYEKKASLLVNPRDTDEDFTRYSFPSKTIEYMLSGTPLMTTKLQGIPDEYFDYVFSAEDNSVDCLANALKKALAHSSDELNQIGLRAQKFIIENKNSKNQVKRIVEFFEEVRKHED